MEGLSFANGLTLSPDEDFLLVLESGGQSKIWKYYLKGEKKGQAEIFSVMPGIVDNITPNSEDGYLLGIIVPMKHDAIDNIIRRIRSFYPAVRLLVRVMRLIQLCFQCINDYILHSDLMETIGNVQN